MQTASLQTIQCINITSKGIVIIHSLPCKNHYSKKQAYLSSFYDQRHQAMHFFASLRVANRKSQTPLTNACNACNICSNKITHSCPKIELELVASFPVYLPIQTFFSTFKNSIHNKVGKKNFKQFLLGILLRVIKSLRVFLIA